MISIYPIISDSKFDYLHDYMEQQTGFKQEKEYVEAVYCHPAYLTSLRSTSQKCWAGRCTSWNQDCWEKYQ